MGKFKIFGLSGLKYEIVRTLHDPIKYLENPEIAAEYEYKGLLDFQFKLTSSLLIHLNKNFFFTKTYTIKPSFTSSFKDYYF